MSVLTDMQLITKEIRIKNYELPDKEYQFHPSFTRTIGETADGRYFAELSISVENTLDKPFPLDLYVCIAGVFDLQKYEDAQIDYFLKVSAIQILFPYIRSIVSSITSACMISPIVLPVIDARKLFPEEAAKIEDCK